MKISDKVAFSEILLLCVLLVIIIALTTAIIHPDLSGSGPDMRQQFSECPDGRCDEPPPCTPQPECTKPKPKKPA